MSLDKLQTKLQSEAKKYAKQALTAPSDRTEFEYGKHHGVMVGFGLVEQWVEELLKEEEDDESE